jgi:hypothetical protein
MIAALAKTTHTTLNKIIVGSVFTVEDHISATLEIMAKMYNHQNCLPNNRPGNMIAIFVANPHASTVFGAVQ